MAYSDQYTLYDALGWYLSTASGVGQPQTDPDQSLGGYRSGSRVMPLGLKIRGGIGGLRIVRWSGANGCGSGRIIALTSDTLAYAAPGGSLGLAVTVANGETKMLTSLQAQEKYVMVTRTSILNLTGTADLIFTGPVNNVIGMSNVSSAEAAAGEDKLRMIIGRNDSDRQLDDFKIWIYELADGVTGDVAALPASGAGTLQTGESLADWAQSGYCRIVDSGGSLREIVYYQSRSADILTVPAAGRGMLGTSEAAGALTDVLHHVPGLRIAKAINLGAGYFAEADDENDPVIIAAQNWNSGITPADGLNIGYLGPGDIVGLWILLSIPAGAAATPCMLNQLRWSYIW